MRSGEEEEVVQREMGRERMRWMPRRMVWRIRTQYSYIIKSHVIMEQVAASRGEARLGSSDRVGFQMALYHTRPAGERA